MRMEGYRGIFRTSGVSWKAVAVGIREEVNDCSIQGRCALLDQLFIKTTRSAGGLWTWERLRGHSSHGQEEISAWPGTVRGREDLVDSGVHNSFLRTWSPRELETN